MEQFINKVIQGDCLIKLKELEDNSIDSIVTDPPYELGFMGKSWDNTGIANNPEMWKECLRVLKPGGHLLAFSGTRTYHRMASAIEDAGFEVRDMIEWVYGSGFPKSLNIGKAVDKLHGNEREVVGKSNTVAQKSSAIFQSFNGADGANLSDIEGNLPLTKGTSEWEGWGTALKPAHEPICMARKPLAEKTVAENCLKYGTGGINIDESRVETEDKMSYSSSEKQGVTKFGTGTTEQSPLGRFPANLILGADENGVHEEVRECFPETTVGARKAGQLRHTKDGDLNFTGNTYTLNDYPANSGNASRFFKSIIYTAKASKSERNKWCEELYWLNGKQIEKELWEKLNQENETNKDNKDFKRHSISRTNIHPTVKNVSLMSYLIKMVTPKGGIVLDPFAGSGSTLVAAKQNGYKYIGIELTEEYIPIIEARLLGVENDLFKDIL